MIANRPFYSYVGDDTKDSADWHPLPGLKREDADITIMFLAANSVSYRAPVYDPLFMATIKDNYTLDGEVVYQYKPDYLVRALACADQYQICNPHKDKCTPLTGKSLVLNNIAELDLSNFQNQTIMELGLALQMQATYFSVQTQGARALRAADTLISSSFIQIGLPPDQWMTEVTEWFRVSMARLQQTFVSYATGPNYMHSGMRFAPGSKDICGRQKIRSASGYVSFSVLGVSIILILGSILIFSALFLDLIVGVIMKYWNFNDHKHVQWVSRFLGLSLRFCIFSRHLVLSVLEVAGHHARRRTFI